jgi:hypothetical protein
MGKSEQELLIEASSLAARATSRITAELGPRALPTQRDHYLATADVITREVIGRDWEFRISMDLEGKPYVFINRYNPPRAEPPVITIHD